MYIRRILMTVSLLLVFCTIVSVHTSLAAPGVPTPYSPSYGGIAGGTAVTFSWSEPYGATDYYLVVADENYNLFYEGWVWNYATLSPFPDNGAVYYWQVAACDYYECSAYSSVMYFYNGPSGPPVAPTLVSPANGSTVNGTDIDFIWNASSRAYWYYLQVSPDPSFATYYETGVSSNYTGVPLMGFPDNGQTYYWRVIAWNPAGSSYSSVRYFTNGPSAAPAAPTLVSPANGSTVNGTDITFIWDPAARAYWYYLQISDDPAFATYSEIDVDGNFTGIPLTGFPDNGQTYYWRVIAWNPAGSSYSSVRYFTNGPSAAPATPTLVSPANGSTVYGTDITFIWDPAARAYWYYLQISDDPAFATYSEIDVDGNFTGIPLTGFPDNGQTYYWRVIAWNPAGSSYSSVRYFTNGPSGPPATPTLVSPANGSTVYGTDITFIWDPAARTYWYYLQISDDPAFATYSEIGVDGNFTGIPLTGFPDNGITLYWRVEAWSPAGSSFSSVWYFTNGPSGPPATPTLVSPADGSTVNGTDIDFIWNAASRAYWYYLQVSPDPTFATYFEIGVDGYYTGIPLTGFPDNGITLYWRVKAWNPAGSTFSSVWYFFNGPSAAPDIPTLVSPPDASTVNGTTVTFEWTPSARTYYQYLQIAIDPSFAFDTIVYEEGFTPDISSKTIGGFPDSGEVYYWRVDAWNPAGSTYSSAWYFSNGPSGPPADPVLISPANGSNVTGTIVEFDWEDSDRSYYYYLEVATDPSFAASTIVHDVGTYYSEYPFNNFPDSGQTYYWRVIAWNPAGYSNYSSIWSFTNGSSTSCVPSTGTGTGVLSNTQTHVDTCYYGSTSQYALKDVSRRAGQTGHSHSGLMASSASIYTKDYYSGLMWDADNAWNTTGQESAVDGHVYAGWVYDFLLSPGISRNSFDNSGGSMNSITDVPCGNDNAYWDGYKVNFCSGYSALPLSGAQDVVAHEWGHAVTQYASGLKYEKESGALNEAFSDWMGAAVEHANGEINWTMGEGIWTIRDISNPLSYGQPDTYGGTSYRPTSGCVPVCDTSSPYYNDCCYVHTNSGVPNKMFHLLSDGGTHPVSKVTVQGLGITKAFRIAYLASLTQWVSTSIFADARDGMVTVAESYGVNSHEVFQVKNAWAAVGVGTLPAITTSVSPSAAGTTSGGGDYTWGSTATVVAAANTGYVFRNWAEGGVEVSTSASYSFTVEGSRTLVANFDGTPPSISLGPASYDFGSVYLGDASPLQTFTVTNLGSELLNIGTIGISGADAAEFNATVDSCSGQSLAVEESCTVQVEFFPATEGLKTAVLSIPSNDPDTPVFDVSLSGTGTAAPTFTITATAGFGGIIAPSGAVTVEYKASQTFTITPDIGYYIADVLVDSVSMGQTGTYTFDNVTADHTIEAVFGFITPGTHTLTVNRSGMGTVTSAPAGINCGTQCTAVYSAGTTVTLTAVPASGHAFTGWSGGVCMGTGNCAVTMNANTTVDAVFEDLSSQVDIVFVIDSTGSMWDDIDYVKASSVEIVDSIDFSISDYRIAVVDYKDFPQSPYGGASDYPYRAVQPFTTDKTTVINALQSLSASGGMDWDESVYSALIRAISTEGLGAWRSTAKKSIILMGDAPPHDPEPFTGYTMDSVIEAANNVDSVISHAANLFEAFAPLTDSESPVSIYSIVIGTDARAAEYFAALSEETGGKAFSAATAEDVVGEILDAIEDIVEPSPPVCDTGVASVSMLWPPNHRMVDVNILNVIDPDDDPVSVTITGITQDEAVKGRGSGNSSPDAYGVGTDTAWIRAERSGKERGRVYEIHFTATDGKDGECAGSVLVCVPHDQGQNIVCTDGGQYFDSTTP